MPPDPIICGVSHVQWADKQRHDGADGGNVVFYGDKAIDRCPCRTTHRPGWRTAPRGPGWRWTTC